MTGINVEAVIMTHCKCQDIKSPVVDSRLHRIHPHKAGQQVTNVHKWSLAVISWLHLPESAHQLKNFFDCLIYFFIPTQVSTLHSGAFGWICSVGAQATAHVNNTVLFIHGQILTISLSSAKRDLIKEPCSLSANHRGLFKVCTCSTASYIFNEGKLLHLSQVNGSSAPLVVKISTEWGKNTSDH